MRLTHEETSFRAVAVAGNWATASAADIQQAPLVQRQPPFSFIVPQAHQQWVIMPAWSAVMIAAEPVALVLDDCAKIEVLLKQTQVMSCSLLHPSRMPSSCHLPTCACTLCETALQEGEHTMRLGPAA